MPNPAQISDVQTTGKQEEIRESIKKPEITKQKRAQFIEKHHKTRQDGERGTNGRTKNKIHMVVFFKTLKLLAWGTSVE